jgi:hypothetical protein
MNGTPVWLASLSRRSPITGDILATPLWSERTMQSSLALLRRVLGPAGNAARERAFRMQITACLHRALTDDEVAGLPASFHAAEPIDLAGGPVEVLYETEPGRPSTRPCVRPERRRLDDRGSLLWYPVDCGGCEPCRARAAHARRADAGGHAARSLPDLFENLRGSGL